VLATSSAVTFANGFAGTMNFFFLSDVPLTPAQTYAFEVVVQSGSDLWNASAGEYSYAGGMVFANGLPAPASDMWFREGLVVPEPSSIAIILVGGCLLGWYRRRT
jgi:hypothetical protein